MSDLVSGPPLATQSRLRGEGLTKIYRKRRVVNDISISVSQGEAQSTEPVANRARGGHAAIGSHEQDPDGPAVLPVAVRQRGEDLLGRGAGIDVAGLYRTPPQGRLAASRA